MYKCKKEKSTREYSKKQRGIIRSKHHHNPTIFKVDIYIGKQIDKYNYKKTRMHTSNKLKSLKGTTVRRRIPP
jgi:hypothetical protein